MTFVLFAYSKSAGDVLLDTSLPMTDVSADINATVNGIENEDRQENSRSGLTLALPIGDRHSVKFGRAPGHFHSHRRELQYLRGGLADPLASKAALIATAGPRNGLY